MKLYIFLLILVANNIAAQITSVSSGSVERLPNFKSKYIEPRHVDVWLPEGYSKAKRYAVLYMHDGQMLFDPATTWNRQAWEVDSTAAVLNEERGIKNFIVVGIHSIANIRHSDLFPQKPFESLPQAVRDSLYDLNRDQSSPLFTIPVNSDNYLRFIVEELKPYIDKTYSVKTDRDNTFIAGSSMGGLISLYAICEYPNIFGGAACISTHWPGTFSVDNNPIPEAFFRYMSSNLPDPATHRIYFDHGDQTLDALYPPLQQQADQVMLHKGFGSKNWMTKFYPGTDHSETSWRTRLDIPLRFLLGIQ